MAIDREKVSTAAQKYVEKKKYDKAVIEYQKLVQADPNDARTLLKIGDLQLKMGAHEQAIATYESVGNLYAKQGWALKAIAVYKQIREIIAKHVPHLDEKYGHIAPRLAELYQQLGLISDALAALDEVATKLQRQQRDGEAIEVFQKIVALDPTNPLPHLRLAEALSRSKDIDGAVFEFKTAAAQLAGLGRRDDALKVLERLLHHKPDAEQARIAAELYLSRGQPQDGMQALAKLQICFQANPRDLDTLQLLARAFNAIGQSGKAIEVQKEMARIARDAGKTDLAREIIDRLMRLAPNDEGVRKLALGSVPAPAPIHSQVPQGMSGPPQAMQQMPQMTQPIPGGRPGGPPQYPPPPPAVTRGTAPAPFAPQAPPAARQAIPSGPMLSSGHMQPHAHVEEQAHEDDVEEVDELSYEDASDDVESVDEQAELVDNDQPAEGEQAYEGGQETDQAYELNPDDPQYADPNAAYEVADAAAEGGEVVENAYADSASEGGEIQYQSVEGEGGEFQEGQVYAEQHEYVEGDGQYAAGEDVGAQLAQLLADAHSYRRLGLYAKATDTLRAGLDLEPRSMDLREALRDTLLEAGHNEDAVLEMLAIAGLYIDALDGESAARALQDVLALDPTNQRAIEMLQELGYEIVDESEGEPQDTEAGERTAYVPSGGAGPGGEEDRLPSYDLEEMGPEDVSAHYTGESRRIRPSSQRPPPMHGDAQSADDDGALPSFPLDGPEEYEPESHAPSTRPGDAATEHPQYAGEAGHDTGENWQAGQAGGHADGTDQHGAYSEEAAPATVAPAGQTHAPSQAPNHGGSAELEEALEESEFFVSRGLYEDARAILADHFARNPNHPLLRERIAEIDAQLEEMRGVQGGSGARERPQEDRSFDIAANIDSLDSIETGAPPQQSFHQEQQQVDVEEVFAKFKEGVAAQISIEDSESHENLGIAYKEMGLTDDAIREFEIAARDPKRECVCQFNIGMVEMERGRIAEAIDAFLRGLNAQEKEPQQETMLCYEIGAAYEAMKMNREALTYFQKTMRRDPAYRDVQERVRRLAKPEPKAAPIKAAVGADDEFDRAFDDLLGGKS